MWVSQVLYSISKDAGHFSGPFVSCSLDVRDGVHLYIADV